MDWIDRWFALKCNTHSNGWWAGVGDGEKGQSTWPAMRNGEKTLREELERRKRVRERGQGRERKRLADSNTQRKVTGEVHRSGQFGQYRAILECSGFEAGRTFYQGGDGCSPVMNYSI